MAAAVLLSPRATARSDACARAETGNFGAWARSCPQREPTHRQLTPWPAAVADHGSREETPRPPLTHPPLPPASGLHRRRRQAAEGQDTPRPSADCGAGDAGWACGDGRPSQAVRRGRARNDDGGGGGGGHCSCGGEAAQQRCCCCESGGGGGGGGHAGRAGGGGGGPRPAITSKQRQSRCSAVRQAAEQRLSGSAAQLSSSAAAPQRGGARRSWCVAMLLPQRQSRC